jgi:hypothetical protein
LQILEKKKADIRLVNIDTGAIKIPYLDERFNLKSSFDSIRLSIANIERDGDELHLDGYMAIANLKLNHPKIASKDVVLNTLNLIIVSLGQILSLLIVVRPYN